MSIYLDKLKTIWHNYLSGELLSAALDIKALADEADKEIFLDNEEMAIIYEAKGEILYSFEEKDSALFSFNKSLSIRKKLLPEAADTYMYIEAKMAYIYAELGHSKEAFSLLDGLSSTKVESLKEKPISHVLVLNSKSLAYLMLGECSKALVENTDAIQIVSNLKEGISQILVNKLVADCITQRGKIFISQGDYEEASKCIAKGYEIRQKQSGQIPHFDLIDSAIARATIAEKLQNFKICIAEYEYAAILCKKVFGNKHKKTITLITKLKYVYQDLSEVTEIAIAKDDRLVPGYWQRREATKSCFAEREK
jgi:tetratricopeptide (TPR) repeat protein